MYSKCGWLVSVPEHKPILKGKVFLWLLVISISEISQPKLDCFLLLFKQIKSLSVMPVRLFAKFLVPLNFFGRALGQFVRLLTRGLYYCLLPVYFTQEHCNSVTSLSDSVIEELIFCN